MGQGKGIYERKSSEEVIKAIKNEGKSSWWEFIPYKGESYEQVSKRLLSFIKDLSKKDYKNVAIISHGGPINILLGHITKTPKSQIEKFSHKNASFSQIKYDKKSGFRILKLNRELK